MAGLPNSSGLEHHHQVALFEWAALNVGRHPELRFMFAIPNGGLRHATVAAKLRREGVRPGVPDVCLPVPRGGYHGLWIEMKAGGNKPSDKQREYLDFLLTQGYLAQVCNGVDAAIFFVHAYLEGEWIRPSSEPAGVIGPSSSSPAGPA